MTPYLYPSPSYPPSAVQKSPSPTPDSFKLLILEADTLEMKTGVVQTWRCTNDTGVLVSGVDFLSSRSYEELSFDTKLVQFLSSYLTQRCFESWSIHEMYYLDNKMSVGVILKKRVIEEVRDEGEISEW